MDIIDKIQVIAENIENEYINQARHDNKKVLGYMCSFMPEEILHAAGLAPYRIRAVKSTGTRLGDTYYSAINCSLVRHIFDKVLNGKFSFLDGVIFLNGCDHTRRMYDNWRDARDTQGIGPDFLHMLVAPHITSDTGLARYTKELHGFCRVLEKNFNVHITPKTLRESVALYNKRRELLRALNNTRKKPQPAISGSEILSVMLAVTAIPVEPAIELLKQLVTKIDKRVVGSPDKLRIMIAGGAMEEIGHIQMIEDSGAVVVAENICTGGRHADVPVDESKDPIDAIAERYLRHVSCPRMIDDFANRAAFFEKIMNEYQADAIIVEKLMFCDLWGGEMFLLKKEAARLDFPILSLERELYGGGEGQLKTRVQAFFEKVRNLKSKK